MDVHRRVTPSIRFAGALIERGTVRVKCLAQEHSKTSLARARTGTVRSGVKRRKLQVTAPPTRNNICKQNIIYKFWIHPTLTTRNTTRPTQSPLLKIKGLFEATIFLHDELHASV